MVHGEKILATIPHALRAIHVNIQLYLNRGAVPLL